MELIYATMYTMIKEKILDALNQKLDRTNEGVQHTNLYIYNPLLNHNNKEVGKNVMIKKGLRYDECTDDVIYANEFKDYNIDDDVLYVHPYNMHNLLKSIYPDITDRDTFINKVKTSTLFGKVVNMEYLKRMSSKSASDDPNNFNNVSIPFNRSFYEQYKVFALDEDGNMTVRFMYIDFKDIMKRPEEENISD